MHGCLAVLAVVAWSGAAQDGTAPAVPAPVPPPSASPEVRPDRTVVFRFRAPSATGVVLQFDGLRPMTKGAAGIWTATVGPVEPDIYSYNFVVDGVRVPDLQNPDVRTGWGIYGSIVEVPGDPPRLHERQAVPHGTLSVRTYYSTVLKRSRTLYLYTPPQYDTRKRAKFPVLVLRHATGDTEVGWSGIGRAGMILDNLIAARQATPMIVVMPNGDTDRSFAGANSPAAIDLLGRELLVDVLPEVERRYRVAKGRENRAIAGLAMGGGQAFTIGLNHPDRFAWIGEFGSGLLSDTPYQLEKLAPGFLAHPAEANRRLRLLYLSCGMTDPRYGGHVQLAARLKANGIRHVWFATPGMNDWSLGRESLADFARRLFRK